MIITVLYHPTLCTTLLKITKTAIYFERFKYLEFICIFHYSEIYLYKYTSIFFCNESKWKFRYSKIYVLIFQNKLPSKLFLTVYTGMWKNARSNTDTKNQKIFVLSKINKSFDIFEFDSMHSRGRIIPIIIFIIHTYPL